MFCVEANCATVCLQGTHAIWFFQLLEPAHVPPHRVAFMRIIRLLDKAVLREYQRIVNDNALLYSFDFVSTNSDFYTNKERRELYGCLVANMTAQQHIFEVCLCGFIVCRMLLFLFSHTNLTHCPVGIQLNRGWPATICKHTNVQ
jgi:hypothetical protein